jgi:phage shock protein A
MFKSMFRLMHGQLPVGAGCVDDRNALALIAHQARVAARDLAIARRELAAAVASERSEAHRLRNLKSRMATLDGRAVAAVRAGFSDMAEEAAADLAVISTDYLVGSQCLKVLAAEIERQKQRAADAEMRLARCDRGRRIVMAEQAVRALRERTTGRAEEDGQLLAEAEATLACLRRSQMEGLTSRTPAARAGAPGPLPGVFAGPASQRRSPSAAEVLVGIRNRAMMASRVA